MSLRVASPVASPVASASQQDDVSVRLVTLTCPAALSASALSDALIEAGALYVGVSDGNEGTPEEEPIFATHETDGAMKFEYVEGDNPESWDELLEARQLWSNSTLEVGFAPSADVERAMLSVVANAGMGESGVEYSVEDLAPRDWVSEVQSNWPPVALPGVLTIRFPWHDAEDIDESHGPIVTLHPGMAFGTGEHATTRMCCVALRRLLSDATADDAILDYGAGSGILSFAALHFGASRAVGVEIDVDALATSKVNAVENGFGSRYEALLPEEEEQRQDAYPLVVANILAGTLIELADVLASRVAPGGTLLMSGIWGDEQAERVQAAFEQRGFGPFALEFAPGGWALLEAKRG